MSFTLKDDERELLTRAEKKFMDWRKSEAQLDADFGSYRDWRVAAAPLADEYGIALRKATRGAPGNHLGHVWVRIAAEAWKAAFVDEPAAKNGRFQEALAAFAVGKPHLPTFGSDLIEEEVKNWRAVRLPTDIED